MVFINEVGHVTGNKILMVEDSEQGLFVGGESKEASVSFNILKNNKSNVIYATKDIKAFGNIAVFKSPASVTNQ